MARPVFYLNYPGHELETVSSIDVLLGSVPAPIVWGYTFLDWYEDAACTKKAEVDLEGGTYYAAWEVWDEAKTKEIEAMEAELKLAKYRIARPKAYTWESFKPYFLAVNKLIFHFVPYGDPETVAAMREAEKNLIEVADPEAEAWYLWGDRMPEEPEAKTYSYFNEFDYAGFRPFLVPYMLEDQSKVKGNVIIVAGGGYARRYNQTEGYNIAMIFNTLGYNGFVLQRRCTPNARIDAALDLQRAVRYLKYNAEKYGIGAIDHIATNGYSGGGSTINLQLEQCYGYRTGKDIYPDYEPDEIDAIDSDYQVAMPIYGGNAPGQTENPHIPSIFAVVGARDVLMLGRRNSMDNFMDRLYSFPDYDMELHIFGGAPHGFGSGFGVTGTHFGPCDGYFGAHEWMKLADNFMMVRFGLKEQTYPATDQPVPGVIGF